LFTAIVMNIYRTKQVAQLSQRDRAAGWVSYSQKWNWETIFTDIISLYTTTVTYLASKAIKIGENTKKGYYAIQGQSRSCEFLLVINSNWQPILYHCGVVAAYCSNFGHIAFLSHPLAGLRTVYDIHFGLIGKRIVDFLLVII